jgi:hypothetical protein
MPYNFLVAAMTTLPLKTVADATRQAQVKKHCVWLAYYYKGSEEVTEDMQMPDQFLVVALDAICDDPEDFVKRFSHAFRAKNYDVCVSMLFTNTIDAYCQRHDGTLRVKEFYACAEKFADYCECFIQ